MKILAKDRFFVVGAIAMLWWVSGIGPQTVSAATLTWTGNTDSNWFEKTNWDPATRYPEAGDTIVIPNTVNGVLLTNSTAALVSLTISGNTLTFEGWETILDAETVHIGEGAIVTHHVNTDTSGTPGDYGSWTPDHRVYIVCTDFTLHTNATINVDGRGYQAPVAPHNAWGHGPGAPFDRAGGGYGGTGGHGDLANTSEQPGGPYGSYSAPIDPGSSGSGASAGVADGYYNPAASHGGGVVRIVASGTVTLHGTISANGINGLFRSSGGSGGSIFITCNQWAGSANGLLQANGGTGAGVTLYGGGGSGGRIAVAYHPPAQTEQPPVRFSTRFGQGVRWPYKDAHAGRGTLYFPDTFLLTETWNSQFQETYLYLGEETEWSVPSLTIENTSVTIANTGFVFSVSENLTIDNATLRLVDHVNLICSGDLVLTNGARLVVHAGATNATAMPHGAYVNIAGLGSFSGNSWLRPVSHPVNGGTPRLSFKNLTIAENSGVDADSAGFRGGTADNDAAGPGAGGGTGNVRGGGGGHGGQGGVSQSGLPGGITNGFVFTPKWPGSGGGAMNHLGRPGDDNGYGGGMIRLDVADTLELHGTLRANGGGGSWRGGAGAGGAIFVTARNLVSSMTAKLEAAGGEGLPAFSGGGGGGRIAVWIDVPQIVREQTMAMGLHRLVDAAMVYEDYHGTHTVAAGAGWDATNADPADRAQPGSFHFLTWTGVRGTLFLIR